MPTTNEPTTYDRAMRLYDALTTRPQLTDGDGYVDFVADRVQMLEIIEKHLAHKPTVSKQSLENVIRAHAASGLLKGLMDFLTQVGVKIV